MGLSIIGAGHFQIEKSGTVLIALKVISAQKLCVLYNLQTRINNIKRLLPRCSDDKL